MILILKKRNLKICLNGRKLLFGPASFLIIIIVLIVTDNNRQTNIITLSLFLLKKETKKPKLIKHNFYKIFFKWTEYKINNRFVHLYCMYYFYILLCAWWCICKGPYINWKLAGLHPYLKVLQFFYFLINFFSFRNNLSWYYSSCPCALLRVDFFLYTVPHSFRA